VTLRSIHVQKSSIQLLDASRSTIYEAAVGKNCHVLNEGILNTYALSIYECHCLFCAVETSSGIFIVFQVLHTPPVTLWKFSLQVLGYISIRKVKNAIQTNIVNSLRETS
jgi:hypothetical protein